MNKTTKKRITVAVSCLIVIAVMSAFTALIAIPSLKKAAINSAKESLFENYYTFPASGLITAENGFGGNSENSLLYVKSAVLNNADCVEIDVCFDEDGKPYVTDDYKSIDENTMPLEYLISYFSEEAIKSNISRHFLNLHIVDASGLEKIEEILKQYDMREYCFLTGVNVNQASFVRSSCDIDFYLDYELEKGKIHNIEYISTVMSEVSSSGAMGINCSVDVFSTELENIFKENWLKISFFDVETEKDIIKAVSFSPNQIITSDPEGVRSLLTEWNANAPSSDIIKD